MPTELYRRDLFDDSLGRAWHDLPTDAPGVSVGITTYLYDAQGNLLSVEPPIATDEPRPDAPHIVES